jgi:hypothetical protein
MVENESSLYEAASLNVNFLFENIGIEKISNYLTEISFTDVPVKGTGTAVRNVLGNI